MIPRVCNFCIEYTVRIDCTIISASLNASKIQVCAYISFHHQIQWMPKHNDGFLCFQ